MECPSKTVNIVMTIKCYFLVLFSYKDQDSEINRDVSSVWNSLVQFIISITLYQYMKWDWYFVCIFQSFSTI